MKKLILICFLQLLISNILLSQNPVHETDSWIGNVTFIPTGGTSIYDLQSNASPEHIWQDPNIPANIHTVYMSSPWGDPYPDFPGRTTQYFFSSDYGNIWSLISNVYPLKSGFPSITGTSSGSALIGINLPYNSGPIRIVLFLDLFPGLGSFTALDPGYLANRVYQYSRVVATKNVSLQNKFVYVGCATPDSCFINIYQSSGNFSGYQFFSGRPPEGYSIARGGDGRIGIAYVADEYLSPANRGNIFFIESLNNGTTFSSPLKIFQRNYINDSNIVGGYRGIFITYLGNSPKVVFETIRQKVTGAYYETLASSIRFWSPVLPGADPNKSIIIADSTKVPFAPIVGVNDDIAPICRPVIGASLDSTRIFVAFMVATSQLGGTTIPTNFNDVYLTYSQNGGYTWYAPEKITPSNPRTDWTYPSISPASYFSGTGNHYANLVIQSDSIPGSYIHGNQNGPSLAKQIFTRVTIPDSLPPNVPPNDPILICPVVHHMRLEWYPVWNASSYQVQISLNSIFNQIIFDSANITNSYLQPPGILLGNTTYYWRVRAINAYGSSPGSSTCTIIADTIQNFSVSGNVKYRDNNQIVTSGYVKAMKINPLTGQITVSDSAQIQPDGTYLLPNVQRTDSLYISGYPNSGQGVDYKPTYYPSILDWENAVRISVNSNLSNINVFVFRIYGSTNYSTIEGTVSKSAYTSGPLSGVLVYSKTDTLIRGFAITDEYGRYTLNYMPSGTQKIKVNRMGYKSDSTIVTLNPFANLNNINFTLNPYWTGITNQGNEIPTSYNLYQNYPNPFNPITKIKFDIPPDVKRKTLNVKLIIYDVLGREIQTLVNEKLNPGSYEVTFDGSNLSSGIYFYQLKTDKYIETRKMLLIK